MTRLIGCKSHNENGKRLFPSNHSLHLLLRSKSCFAALLSVSAVIPRGFRGSQRLQRSLSVFHHFWRFIKRAIQLFTYPSILEGSTNDQSCPLSRHYLGVQTCGKVSPSVDQRGCNVGGRIESVSRMAAWTDSGCATPKRTVLR